MKIIIEREKLTMAWNVGFATGTIPQHPEFQLFIDPIAAQREAWICSQLMKTHNKE